MYKPLLSLLLAIACLWGGSDLYGMPRSPKVRQQIQQIQDYINDTHGEHSRQGQQLIAAMAWEAIPRASRDIQVKKIQIAQVNNDLEFSRKGKLSTGSWIETWQVEMDRTVYSVNFIAMVKGGKLLLRLLYVGDLYDPAEIWSLKYDHLMSRIQEEDPSFYGLIQQKGRVFLTHRLLRHDSATGASIQEVEVYCAGKKLSYRLQGRLSSSGDTTIRYSKVS